MDAPAINIRTTPLCCYEHGQTEHGLVILGHPAAIRPAEMQSSPKVTNHHNWLAQDSGESGGIH